MRELKLARVLLKKEREVEGAKDTKRLSKKIVGKKIFSTIF